MVADFHRRGVKVLFPAMPWTPAPREGVPLWEAKIRDLAAIGADGINGDTMGGIPVDYRKTSDRVGHVSSSSRNAGFPTRPCSPGTT